MSCKSISLLIGLIALLQCNLLRAQHKTTHPVAVLVQLSSEQNRFQYFKHHELKKELKQIKKDATTIAYNTRMDFRDNFKLYPVYFFIDTNINLIKERKFAEILFHADGSVANDYPLNDTSTDYVIAYYGYPIAKLPRIKYVDDDEAQNGNFDSRFGRGLVVNNYKMEQISYVYLPYPKFIKNISMKHKKYYYQSPMFDLNYYPIAAKLYKIIGAITY